MTDEYVIVWKDGSVSPSLWVVKHYNLRTAKYVVDMFKHSEGHILHVSDPEVVVRRL